MRMRSVLILAALLVLGGSATGSQPGGVPPDWATPAELANFEATPSYADTVAFLNRISHATPAVRLESFGRSGEGRDMVVAVVSTAGALTPEAAAARGLPVVMVQNGIHAGEIDGKDACLAILRDFAVGRYRGLLDGIVLLVVPVYNVDGHERVSPFNRANQDGPHAGMGFRTTTAGYDLNRDFLKLESPEARALIGLVNRWRPQLHVDVHVTDGVDHGWVLTWGCAEAPQLAPSVDRWVAAHLTPALAATEAAGFPCGPYVDLVDRDDPGKGFSSFVGGGRYSTGYFPLRNRASILIETHSYKPYERRVRSVEAFLLALLAEVSRDPRALRQAVSEAEARTVALGRGDAPPSEVALSFAENPEPDRILFPVYAWSREVSTVTGQPLTVYRRGEVNEIEVPWFHRPSITLTALRPRGYLVPPGWPQIEQRLADHGLRVERLRAAVELEVETARVTTPKFEAQPYQGHLRVEGSVTRAAERRRLPAGTLWVPADQPDFEVAVQLLEPESPESLFAWGFLSTVLEQREYIDTRNLERLAREMLADPAVAAEWSRALADEKLAGDRRARVQWWYRRTPYWTVQEVGLLPAYRLNRPATLSTEPWPGPSR